MCPRCSAISTRHMSEQVNWCVATRHLTVEATKPGPTVHVSVRPQDICHGVEVSGFHSTYVRIHKWNGAKIVGPFPTTHLSKKS